MTLGFLQLPGPYTGTSTSTIFAMTTRHTGTQGSGGPPVHPLPQRLPQRPKGQSLPRRTSSRYGGAISHLILLPSPRPIRLISLINLERQKVSKGRSSLYPTPPALQDGGRNLLIQLTLQSLPLRQG